MKDEEGRLQLGESRELTGVVSEVRKRAFRSAQSGRHVASTRQHPGGSNPVQYAAQVTGHKANGTVHP